MITKATSIVTCCVQSEASLIRNKRADITPLPTTVRYEISIRRQTKRKFTGVTLLLTITTHKLSLALNYPAL
jgi:hypothetical protein